MFPAPALPESSRLDGAAMERAGGHLSPLFSSRSDEWSTPPAIFADLDSEFSFTLDAAATPSNAKCARFFTRFENGLLRDLVNEIVFCNPPYSDVASWVRKAAWAATKGATVVLLVPSRTDTAWFHDFVLGQADIRFLRGRLSFGDGKGRAPFPSMVVVFRSGFLVTPGLSLMGETN